MDTNHALMTMDRKAKLSAAWVFVLLNVIFRDLHELFRPGMLAEMTTGTVNGVQMTEQTLCWLPCCSRFRSPWSSCPGS